MVRTVDEGTPAIGAQSAPNINARVFRVQDVEGRGPWRPGLSRFWADPDGPAGPPTWMAEFGALDMSDDAFAYGCGFDRPEQARLWFTEAEQHKLNILGFRLVTLVADRILARSASQVVFARRRPLRSGATIIKWPSLLREEVGRG